MSQYNPAETFLNEADDLLLVIEQCALDISSSSDDRAALDRLFRAFHTLKGSGAMFGFDEIAAFTHHIENALDGAREGTVSISPELVKLILEASDEIRHLLKNGMPNKGESILKRLNVLQGEGVPSPDCVGSGTAPTDLDGEGSCKRYLIRFTPPKNIFTTGQDPASILDDLKELGNCILKENTVKVPLLTEIEPDACYLSWEIRLDTDEGLNAIRDVFIFVEDDSDLSIEEIAEEAELSDSQGEKSVEADRVNEVLQRKPVLAQSTVRVASDKLDRLVNLVGELVMNQSRLSQVASQIDSTELDEPVEEIERLAAELRDSVLGVRMMPIGSTFGRFRRLVHDLSSELHKEIVLETEGEETEIDKTVLDQLGDPLVHLIRNSIDHGIESPDERVASGKLACGKIRLSAQHEGAHVVLTIEDDGKGLDCDRIRKKAEEKGLVLPDAQLGEQDLFNLIFEPGFSTAKDVTNVSGRGVGMDVVKRQLEFVGGDIKVSSKQGQGTSIYLTLPLTLAIIDGLMVEVAGDRFILPMAAVSENVEITADERKDCNGRNLVKVRGELVPYIHLRRLFGIDHDGPELEKVVITTYNRQRLGFVVDRVLGSHQTVIQSIGQVYEGIEVVSGATIMGDGRVALILDVGGLVNYDAAHSASLSKAFEEPVLSEA